MPSVLLIEDNPADALLVRESLPGFSIQHSLTLSEGLQQLQHGAEYDAILTDLSLPDASGIDAVRQLRELSLHTPVIVLSGNVEDHLPLEAVWLGAHDYVRKEDFLTDALELTLRYAIERKRFRMHEVILLNADGILIVSLDGTILHANPAAEVLLGQHSESLSGQPFGFPLSSEGSSEVELPCAGPVPTVRHAELRSSEISWNGQAAYLVSLRDVTEQRRAQAERLRFAQQLQRSQRLESLGVLASGIAHDFNNLLCALLTNADVALSSLGTDEVEGRLANIRAITVQASEIVGQILTYAGEQPANPSRLGINRVVRHTTELIGTLVPCSAEMHFELASGLPPVVADETQIRQVLINLVTNAAQALGPSGGHLTVRSGFMDDLPDLRDAHVLLPVDGPPAAHGWVFFEVEDDGAGIAPDEVARIFDPFFSTKESGRGLGLAVVLGIVRAHAGNLTIQTGSGEGTQFRIWLPASPRVCQDDPRQLSGRFPPVSLYDTPSDRTILVVEDQLEVLEAANTILSKAGFEVLTALNGREGIEQLRANPGIDLVLMDLTMPIMGGEDALKLIRQSHPGLPVLIASGYTNTDVIARLFQLGVSGFLPKPYSSVELLENIGALLSERASLAS